MAHKIMVKAFKEKEKTSYAVVMLTIAIICFGTISINECWLVSVSVILAIAIIFFGTISIFYHIITLFCFKSLLESRKAGITVI